MITSLNDGKAECMIFTLIKVTTVESPIITTFYWHMDINSNKFDIKITNV